jgi:hypothetical protein
MTSAMRDSSIGLVVILLLCGAADPAAGQPVLGPEEYVQADDFDVQVSGYSVPRFVHWDGDNLPDLIVGEGGGLGPAKVRVYPSSGKPCEPEFSNYAYAQSLGEDLVVSGGG